jgi:hypothetical protein
MAQAGGVGAPRGGRVPAVPLCSKHKSSQILMTVPGRLAQETSRAQNTI